MYNINHVLLNYVDTFLKTFHVFMMNMMKTLILNFTLIVISRSA